MVFRLTGDDTRIYLTKDTYGLLLQSECRYWSRDLPFMFENIGVQESSRVDEMLMPADLLAEGSVLRNAVEAMTPQDCGT
ncbi:hypothetical protein B5790_2073, partial [Bifidobacterium dentium]